ncbi:cupin-like domain-containing protein [Variovorax sp. RA8]|uniref:cupin-like domain-containing protein n=1 Tax=Variovorax sp. (strain JCM 16519 / RA8) TaxID=662548 RepID=UPI000AE2D33A|nr:cupin-like domain-containing protein [Variovorax sp. RA8]VTU21005.1 Cupin superfamily protein [Variovorax sp. RA8]
MNPSMPPAPPRPPGSQSEKAPPVPAGAPLTPEWLRWAAEQLLRGCTPESVLASMIAAGLDPQASAELIELVPGNAVYVAAEGRAQQLRKLESTLANLQLLWEIDPMYSIVDKRVSVSEEEFIERYVRGCRPLVLTGHTRDWPAMQRWSPDYLKERFGHLDVEVQAERQANPRYEEDKASHRRNVRLGDFVDQVLGGGETNDYYLTANNEALRRPDFAPLLEDIGSLPPCCIRAELAERSSFWFGPAGTVTPLHHDTLMLFHTQVVGRKRWRLISPLQGPRLYNTNGVFSPIDLDAVDLRQFPLFAGVRVLEVVVWPGETMFLPLAWWHQVRALDVSVSFSYSNLALPIPNLFTYFDPVPRAVPDA